MSSITGSGPLDFFFDMLFSFLQSIQNLLMQSLLSATIIGKSQGDLEGCIIFAADISFTAMSTIGHIAKGVLYGFSFIGGWLPVQYPSESY